ncbi:MAG: hypothetical protein Q8Q42_03435 [Nanoarchaeota archaeon]|nr:hypothetical protein [Nanoarchaeota archaeon]
MKLRDTISALTLIGLLAGTSWIVSSTSPKIYKGKYHGFEVEAHKNRAGKKIILHYPKNLPRGRIIGKAYETKDQFKSIESLYLTEESPLKKLATPEHMQMAWENVYSE